MAISPRVLVIGGGFGGLSAAKRLAGRNLQVTLLDRSNHHLFQPLLYQVATGGLSPANIAVPLRSLFHRHQDVTVVQDEVQQIDLKANKAISATSEYPFDYVIVAAGGTTSYFGHDDWRSDAPGLKALSDATAIRGRVLESLERAEVNPESGLPTFIMAGGGPTGVEMSGAIAELTRQTLKGEFRRIDPAKTRILLIDPNDRLLSQYPAELSDKAAEQLRKLGVEVQFGYALLDVDGQKAVIGNTEKSETIDNAIVIWAAGVSGSPLAGVLATQTKAELAHGKQVSVTRQLSLATHPHVFAVGDMAYCVDKDEKPLPGVAPVAIQQGKHAAENILRQVAGKPSKDFRYRDYGSMAVIGRGAAVAEMGSWHLSGYPAWLAWLFIHLLQLVGYQNRLLVAFQWGWNYLTRSRSSRLITTPPVAANE